MAQEPSTLRSAMQVLTGEPPNAIANMCQIVSGIESLEHIDAEFREHAKAVSQERINMLFELGQRLFDEAHLLTAHNTACSTLPA